MQNLERRNFTAHYTIIAISIILTRSVIIFTYSQLVFECSREKKKIDANHKVLLDEIVTSKFFFNSRTIDET